MAAEAEPKERASCICGRCLVRPSECRARAHEAARVHELEAMIDASESEKMGEAMLKAQFHERAEKADEELAHVRRELVEMQGEDPAKETSGTLAIYESFKDALEPFGHKNVNVRARIECLVEEWKKLRTECRPGIGLGVMLFQDGRILLGKRHPSIDGGGKWELAGGSLKWGESWEGTARREVREETGLTDLRNYRFVTAKEDYRPEDGKHNTVVFVRFDAVGQACVMEPDKSTGWGWYKLDELPEGPMFAPLRDLLVNERPLLAGR